MKDFEFVTTAAAVETYESAAGVFSALLHEVRELSKKKPDATLSVSKVKLINKVLVDLLTFLGGEPEGKYLQALEDDSLPQVSDALMMMVQFDAALKSFKSRYHKRLGMGIDAGWYWITEELLTAWEAEDSEFESVDDEDEI